MYVCYYTITPVDNYNGVRESVTIVIITSHRVTMVTMVLHATAHLAADRGALPPFTPSCYGRWSLAVGPRTVPSSRPCCTAIKDQVDIFILSWPLMNGIHDALRADHDTTVSWSNPSLGCLVAGSVITQPRPEGYRRDIMQCQDRETPKGYRCNGNVRIVAPGAQTV